MKKIVTSFLITSLLVALNPAYAKLCYEDSCTGEKVADYDCPVSFYKSKNIYDRTRGKPEKVGKLTFYYSSHCKANWAKVREVPSYLLNNSIHVSVETAGSKIQRGDHYENGVIITPMINGAGTVKAEGSVDSGGAYTYHATLEY